VITLTRQCDPTPVPLEGLHPQEYLFCKYYLANGFNKAQAMIAAGYSAKSAQSHGARLLRRKDIAKFIEKRMKEATQTLDENFERKVRTLWGIVERWEGQEPVEIPPNAVINAIAELNKMQGHYLKEPVKDPENLEKLAEEIEKNKREY
jgi:phage terminase small subunit